LAFVTVARLAATVTQSQSESIRPTFKAGVDRVTVTAVVHSKKTGQLVTDLHRDDFEILDNGVARPILEFRSEPAAATVALLVDLSGSMNFAGKMPAARRTAHEMLDGLAANIDRVGLFAFDAETHQLQGFEPVPGRVREELDRTRPFGSTSLFDAVATSGRAVAADGSTRRAVVAITDGADNSSHLTVAEVSRIASEIDVPVYIIVVVPQADRESPAKPSKADKLADAEALADLSGSRLGNLAHWTGGEIFLAATETHAHEAAQQIVDELRHQYFIVFAPDTGHPGWHPIDVRTHQPDLAVRARSGYVAQSSVK